MHLLSDLMGPEPTFTLAGGRDVPYYNNLNSTVQVPRSVDSSSCLPPAASHEETMTASSDEEYDLYARRCRSSPMQADSLSGATINICESGTTLVKHITDPGPALTRTGGGGIEEICLYRDGSAVTRTHTNLLWMERTSAPLQHGDLESTHSGGPLQHQQPLGPRY